MNRIEDLLQIHTVLDDLFFAHQKALLHFEFSRALMLLEEYESILLRHMNDEEKYLLPVYEECVVPKGAGSAKYFFDDHTKMRRFVELFKKRIQEIDRESGFERTLLLILDREAFYLRLCSHHDKRENDFLYPALERILSQDRQSEIISRLDLKFTSTHRFVSKV